MRPQAVQPGLLALPQISALQQCWSSPLVSAGACSMNISLRKNIGASPLNEQRNRSNFINIDEKGLVPLADKFTKDILLIS